MYISESLIVQLLTPIALGKHEFLWVKILNVHTGVNIVIVYFSVGDKQINNDWNESLWYKLNRIVNSIESSGEGIMITGDFIGHIRGRPASHKVKRRS